MINQELFDRMLKNNGIKDHFIRLSKNNRDTMLQQFQQVNVMLFMIPSSVMRDTFFSMLKEQKKALSNVTSFDERTCIPCLRAQQCSSAHLGAQACKFQTIVEAIALHLKMWVYSEERGACCDEVYLYF